MTPTPTSFPLRSVPTSTDPRAIVEAFLGALAEDNLSLAGSLLADNVVYVNVGLPTVRSRRRVMRVLAPLSGRVSFEVYFHGIAAEGGLVLTERTDVLQFGPLRLQFWVAGRFDVSDGQITLWRDSFDYLDCTKAMLRGALGVLVPALRPRAPIGPGAVPGRH